MARRGAGDDLVVLMSFITPGSSTNPYISMLATSLSERPATRVRYFDWRTALIGRYDVFHVHWPEVRLGGRRPLRRGVNRVLFALLMLRLHIFRTAVVRTVHNVTPHERPGRCDRTLLTWLDRRTTGWIRLNDTTPLHGPLNRTILHGHYLDWFDSYPVSPVKRGRLVFAGLIREYKDVPGLIEAFRQVDDPTWTLSVVGSCTSVPLKERIMRSATADQRVSVSFGYADDSTLVREVSSAELVVLPYAEMHNSGAALMALSIGRPVLVPDSEQTRSLAQEVGDQWVQRFEGPLSGAALVAAVAGVRGITAGSGPRLDRRGWSGAAREHRELYETAMTVRRGRGDRGRRTNGTCSGTDRAPVEGGETH